MLVAPRAALLFAAAMLLSPLCGIAAAGGLVALPPGDLSAAQRTVGMARGGLEDLTGPTAGAAAQGVLMLVGDGSSAGLDDAMDRGANDSINLINVARAFVVDDVINGTRDWSLMNKAVANVVEEAALHRTGYAPGPGPSPSQPVGALASEEPGSCTSDVQAALDAVPPGGEVLVCPGAYAGSWVVRQHFVTLRALVGPLGTSLDARGNNGIQVLATGVTIQGFLVVGATGEDAAGILVGDPTDACEGCAAGTLLRDNVLRGNTYGVRVWKSEGTLLFHNTLRDGTRAGSSSPDAGVGLIVARVGAPLLDPGRGSPGTVVLGNNFINNANYAIRSVPGTLSLQDSAPPAVLAALDYFGAATGPNLDLTEGSPGCFGFGAPTGNASCRNGVSGGVVLLGFSPVPN